MKTDAVKQYKESMKYDDENIDCCLHIAQIQEELQLFADSYVYYKRAQVLDSNSDKARKGAKRMKEIMDEKNIKYNE